LFSVFTCVLVEELDELFAPVADDTASVFPDTRYLIVVHGAIITSS